MTTGSDTTVMWPHAQDAKDDGSRQSRETGSDLPPGHPGEPGPAYTLLWGLWPPRTVRQ